MAATFITRGHVELSFPSIEALAAWLVQRAAGAPIELLSQQIPRQGATLPAVAVFTRRPVTRTDARGRTVTTMADVWHGWATGAAADALALLVALDGLTVPRVADQPTLAVAS